MFERKYNIPTICDDYINLFSSCNICCEHCKFQDGRNIKVILKEPDYLKYENKRILFCYSVDPYPYGSEQGKKVRDCLIKLHERNNSIVFLTRRAECLIEDLEFFNNNDYIGISISENCSKNSSEDTIMQMYVKAKTLGLNTWMSLEPIISSQFAVKIIEKFGSIVDFIRVGKDDKKDYDWEKVKLQISKSCKSNNIFIK